MPAVSEYISTRPGQSKIAEMVLSLAAFICATMTDVMLTSTDRVSIYIVTIGACAFASIVLALNTFASEHQPRVFPIIVLIFTCTLTAQLLVVGILAVVRAYQLNVVFRTFPAILWSYAYAMTACASFIWADFIVFAIDIYFAYSAWKLWKSSRRGSPNIAAPGLGFPVVAQGFPAPGQGFSSPGQGFSASGQGYPAPGQGFPAPGQGFPASGQGFHPSGQQFPTHQEVSV